MYTITKSDKMVIYGASFVGRKMLETLKKYGWEVKYFLDKDADVIKEVNGIRVYNPYNDTLEIRAEKDIAVIAVTDEAEHEKIANFLFEKGFEKIILKSYSDDEEVSTMDMVYNNLVEGRDIENIKVPFYQKKELNIDYLSHMYQEKREDTYLIEVPLELLFYEEDTVVRSVYQNKPLLIYFNFLEGRGGIDTLKELAKKNGMNLPRWMEEKRVIYRHLAEQWQRGKWKAYPFVEREKEGRFIVKTALEEVLFCVAKGYRRVTCEVGAEDYGKWLMRDEIAECIATIKKYNLSFVYTPITHPFFYDFPCKREEVGYTRLMGICDYFGRLGIEMQGKRVLDAGTYIGYFAQHFTRMGADVVGIEFDIRNYDMAVLLKKLSGCDGLTLKNMGIQDICDDEEFDIVFMMSVLNWHMNTELGVQIMEKINQVTKDYLVWESGDEIEQEKKFVLEHSSFTNYEKIMETFGTGKIRELGIFSRRG